MIWLGMMALCQQTWATMCRIDVTTRKWTFIRISKATAFCIIFAAITREDTSRDGVSALLNENGTSL